MSWFDDNEEYIIGQYHVGGSQKAIEFIADTGMWETRKGKQYQLRQMDSQHIRNCIKHIDNTPRFKQDDSYRAFKAAFKLILKERYALKREEAEAKTKTVKAKSQTRSNKT